MRKRGFVLLDASGVPSLAVERSSDCLMVRSAITGIVHVSLCAK